MAGAGTTTHYSIRGGDEGKARLDVLATALRPTTIALLKRVGVAKGGRCLDLGCGGGHVTRELARLVGDEGSVVGIDLDARVVELARQDAAGEALHNVEFRAADASAFEEAELDVVYARLLLCHLPNPRDLIERSVESLRPGGALIVEEPEFAACFSFPTSVAYDRCMGLQREVIRHRGGDPDLGPKLPAMFMEAGLHHVGVSVVQPAFLAPPLKDIPHISLEKMAESIAAEGLATRGEIQRLVDDVRSLAADERALLSYPRFFQVWGRRESI